MYDVTSERSFLNLRNWILSITEIVKSEKIKIAIIGNKIDLLSNNPLRSVQSKDGASLAQVIQN